MNEILPIIIGGFFICWLTGFGAGAIVRAIKQFIEKATKQ